MGEFIFRLDGREIRACEGQSVLEAALDAGIFIPHLCHHRDLPDIGGCGLCVVGIGGRTVRACSTPAEPGMEVVSRSKALEHIRAVSMQLMLAGHIDDCNSCAKYLKCEFQMLIQYHGATAGGLRGTARNLTPDESNPLFIRDMERCVACGRCVRVCREVRGVGALVYADDANGRKIISTKAATLRESDCRFCGACAEVCPTGALRDKDGVFAERFCHGDMLVPCAYECPAHLDIPGYLRAVRQGNCDEAFAVVMERAPLPRSLGAVCMRFCEAKCRRQYLDESVAVCDLKRFAAAEASGSWRKGFRPAADTGKRVAVVGSGPAGLTAAWLLKLKGHGVTVFERLPEPGGMMRYGMPAYRLPEAELRADIKEITDAGVELRCGAEIADASQLSGFDAVIWCGGAHAGVRLPLVGADCAGVLTGLDFLREIRMGKRPQIGGNVLVLGGGDVAFDCARSAVRLGARAAVCCMESGDKMPSTERERAEGGAEGVGVYPGRAFVRLISENGRVSGLECDKIKSFSFGTDGKLRVETEPGSREVIACDTAIFAAGQRPDIPAGTGIPLTKRGLADADADGRLGGKLFAAGDAVSGTSSVVQAVGWGQRAAVSADRFLGGDGNVFPAITARRERGGNIRDNPYFGEHRVLPEQTPPDERIGGFKAYEKTFCPAEALRQASRCLQCDLRRDISRPRLYGEFVFGREARK